MMAEQNAKTPRISRGLKILLIGSLTVNLLVVGLAIGAAWRFQDFDKARPAPSVGAMLYRELSREDRKKLREHAWGDKGGLKKRRAAEGMAVVEVLRLSPFDGERLVAVLREQSQSREAFQMQLQMVWVQRLSDMSDAERRDYADRLEERIRHGGKHHKRK